MFFIPEIVLQTNIWSGRGQLQSRQQVQIFVITYFSDTHITGIRNDCEHLMMGIIFSYLSPVLWAIFWVICLRGT